MTQRAGDWTNFKRDAQKFFIPKGEKRNAETHLLLDGGRLFVPDANNREFLMRFARALFEMEWVYLVERKTKPTFYMMLEWDIKMAGDRALSPEELNSLVRIVQTKVMAVAYPDKGEAVHAVVLTAPPKRVELDDGSPATQSGVHMIWKVVVDIPTAWLLRSWMLRELESANVIPLAVRWSEAFDSCIYEENGLRLPGSRKAGTCPSCKGRRKQSADGWDQGCDACQGSGKVDLGRPYALVYVAGPDGEPLWDRTRKCTEDVAAMIMAATIRVVPPEPEAWPIAFPSEDLRKSLVSAYASDKKEAKAGKQKKKTAAAAEAVVFADDSRKKKQQEELVDVAPSDPVFEAVSAYLASEFNGTPMLKHLKRGKTGDSFIANTNCHYCENKGGEHNSSTVYYILKPSGCVQRCFCKKDAVQPAGLVSCTQFTSKPHKIPQVVQDIVFSGAARRRQRKEEQREHMGQSVVPAAEEPITHTASFNIGTAPMAVDQQPGTAASHSNAPFSISDRTPTEYRTRQEKRGYVPRYSPMQFLSAINRPSFKIQ